MIRATAAAISLLRLIRADHGEVIFHQSGGCCDGSSPMCFPDGELRLGANDVMIGQIDGSRFYMSAQQLEKWGRGGMFSLDNGREARFLLRADRDNPSDGVSAAD